MTLPNYATPLRNLISDLNAGFVVPVHRYHPSHIDSFIRSKLVTLDGKYFRLTSSGRECAMWLVG